MPFQGPYNTDWVYVTGSNVHVANHRDWFLTYTPFASKTGGPKDSGMEVLGVGDVQLEVNVKDDSGVGGAYHSIILRDVLHVPDSLVNVVCGPILEDFPICRLGMDGEIRNPETGVTLWLDNTKLYKLWLVGQPWGQTSLDKHSKYWFNVFWSPTERARWEESKLTLSRANEGHKRTHSKIQSVALGASQNGGDGVGQTTAKSRNRNKKQRKGKGEQNSGSNPEGLDRQQNIGNNSEQAANAAPQKPPRYSPEEKAWLKANYGSEFKFLRAHGWKIFKEDDRQRGERLLRATMESEARQGLPSSVENRVGALRLENPTSEDEDEWTHLPTPEEDAASISTNNETVDSQRPYTKLEKRWLHNGYGGETQFLRRHGLDIKNPDHRNQGRQRVRTMMHDDGTYEEPWVADMGRDERDLVMDAIMFGTRPY